MPWVRPISYTAADHEEYRREGYRFLGPVLTEDGLARARQGLDRILRDLHPSLQPDEVYSAHQQEPWLLDLVSEPPLLDVIERQIGPDIVLFSTHCISKAPGTGREVPWHQDLPYWNVSGVSGSIWLALDDVDEENGTMYVLPRWHRRGTLPRRRASDELFDEEIDPAVLPPDVSRQEAGYFLKAGEAAIHDPMLPHRSTPNKSSRWRRVIVIRYMSASGNMGPKEYPDYRSGRPFARKFILLRGEDVAGRGLEKHQRSSEVAGAP